MRMSKSLVTWLCATAVMAAAVQAVAADDESLRQLRALSEGFAAVAADVTPGVVSIETEQTVVAGQNPFRGTPWEFFDMPQSQPREHLREGQGSGVMVRYEREVYVLTNYHVVRGADDIRVELTDERHFEAEVVGTDSLSDLAVLRIDEDDLPVVEWGVSEDLRVGEWVLAIGNPLGQEHTVTAGIVSAKGRARFGREYGSYIQTDAAINPGNSGGALVDLDGKLVGINTAIISRSGGYDGISFAIPVDLARDVLGQLVEHGEVRRGLLGAYIGDLDDVTAEALGMEDTQGVFVSGITKNGPAEAAGLEQGDVILALDGVPMKSSTELRSRIGATAPGTDVEVRYLRDGKERKTSVELGQVTEEALAGGRQPDRPSARESSLGLRLQTLTPELADRLGYEDEAGVLVTAVRPGSRAQNRGLRRGDLILEINQEPVATLEDYAAIMDELDSGAAVLFLVQSRRGTRFVSLRLP